MELWGQTIGIIGMLAIILSFQCKSNKKLVAVLGIGALLFAVSYFMLGQPSAAVFNIISFICAIICQKDSLKNKYSFSLITVLYVVATIYTYSTWWSIVLMSSQIAAAYSLMFRSGTFIRNVRFFYVSPIWLINNTLMCFTIGGIACEIITMASVIISFIRYRKTGFEA